MPKFCPKCAQKLEWVWMPLAEFTLEPTDQFVWAKLCPNAHEINGGIMITKGSAKPKPKEYGEE